MKKFILGVFSGKGGVGKTTVVANLAAVFSQFGKKVSVVDCNFTASHLSLYFNIYLTPLTLNHVLKENCKLEDAVHSYENIEVIPASLDPYEAELVNFSKLKKLLREHLSTRDIIILDTSPGFGKDTLHAAELCDEAIIVTTPDLISLTDVVRGSRILRDFGADVKGVVVNKIFGKGFEFTIKEIEALTELPVMAALPFSYSFMESQSLRIPLVFYSPKSLPALKFYKLAERILNEPVKIELGLMDKIKLYISDKLKRY